ncbi:MAG: beta-ketoacyl-ACP synthase II [Alphaproteobacteria bacterium]
MRRVVVTGMGIVSPLGIGVDHVWKRLINGESGLAKIEHFDVSDLSCQIAGLIPKGELSEGKFNQDDWISPKDARRVDDFIIYGLAAAQQAIEDSGWIIENDEQACRTGVYVGSGIGGLQTIDRGSETMRQSARRLSPFFIPAALINLISGQVSIKYGFKGPNSAVVSACATGTHSIGDAARMIALDDADVMIAGGAEASVCRIGLQGFAQAKALSTGYNDNPTQGSRPWDEGRDGFVMGEGAGIVVLEEYEHAKARGAKIYAEVAGYGMSGDAHHITAPSPDGNGARRCMQAALRSAKLTTADVDYVNAHGTSTPLGDMGEFNAVKTTFGEDVKNISMSSTKSAIGHLLGAAGAVEAIFSIKAIDTGIIPPTLNLKNPSEGTEDIDLVPLKAKKREVNVALSNSFGFGGTNASLVFKKV